MVTALLPAIGYDRAAEIAKEAFRTGKMIRETARGVLPDQQLEELLDLQPPHSRAGGSASGLAVTL
ncbi:MAG: hypothetical protein ACYC0X_08710 [Pirellulaceae bacterium]